MSSIYLTRIDPVVDGSHETQFMLMKDRECIARVGVKHKNVKCAGIRQLFVDPAHRLAGHGSRLLKACIATATEAGCIAIGLEVDASNHDVIPFYQRHGFGVAHEYPGGDLLMSLNLESPIFL